MLAAVYPGDGDKVGVLGNGNGSCGSWTRDKSLNPVQRAWVFGYVTASSQWLLPPERGVMRNLAEGTDADGVSAWVDNYCSSHPLETIYSAAEALVVVLGTKWHARHPKPK